MVIGQGLLAKAFIRYADNNDVVIFASGVSDSSETESGNFLREEEALLEALQGNKEKLFVYFSTCSICDNDMCNSPYILHKMKIEKLIAEKHGCYLIFRLPQVVGVSSNKTTLVNYLYDRIVAEEHFNVWGGAVRHLVDVDDISKIAGYIIDNYMFRNRIITIGSRPYKILELVAMLEKLVGKKAHYRIIDKGTPYEINSSEIFPITEKLGIRFDGHYLEALLKKYYPK